MKFVDWKHLCHLSHPQPISFLPHCSNYPSVFSEIIVRLVNLSFSEDVFPAKFKVVTPLLKKPSLDPDNPQKWYIQNIWWVVKLRPISNLNNISKILERLFLSWLYPHVTSSPNFNHLQSAYHPHHSTETALLQTFDGIFNSADRSQPTSCLTWSQRSYWYYRPFHITLTTFNQL